MLFMFLAYFGSHSWYAKWKCFITGWVLKVCFGLTYMLLGSVKLKISFFDLGFMGCWGLGSLCYELSLMCLENLSWLDVTRRIVDIWLFHWKTALPIKPISEWKYTRSGHYFSSYGDNDSFQSHMDFTAAPMTLFLPAVVDLLIPVMVWGTCVF